MVKRLMFNFTLRITTENTRATIPAAPNVAPIVGPLIAVCAVALLLLVVVVVVVIMIRRKRQSGKIYLMIVSAFLPFSHKKRKNIKRNEKDYKKE